MREKMYEPSTKEVTIILKVAVAFVICMQLNPFLAEFPCEKVPKCLLSEASNRIPSKLFQIDF